MHDTEQADTGPPELSLGRKLLYSAAAVLSSLALLEGSVRLVRLGPSDVYQEHQQLITVLGLPAINDTMVFDPVLFWKLKPRLRRHRVAGEIRDVSIDFSVSTNSRGLRSPELADDTGADPLRILAVGDSCTFGLGVEDEETWPAVLEAILDRSLVRGAEVINAGVPGYTSYQGLRYLEGEGLDHQPDLVVISFGFNDADSWSSRSDVETGRWMDQRARWRALDPWLRKSHLYRAVQHGLRGAPRIPIEASGSAPPEAPRVSPAEFRSNLMAMSALTRARGARSLYLVWPYNAQMKPGSADWIMYQPLIAEAGREATVPVIRLVEAFRAVPSPFLDHVHATAAGNRAAAEEIHRTLRPRRPARGPTRR